MKENVINFDTEAFRQKLKENGLSIQDAGLLIGKSKLYWYQHLKSGTIDKSTFFKFHELLRTSPKLNKDDVTRLDYEKDMDDNSMKELNEDYQLLKELGLERVFRLYALAEYEKRRQS